MEEIQPTILVVDDTEDNLDLLEFALKRKPVHMLRATSGKECLSLAVQHRPDVILLDIQMPEMDGFETLKHLRASRNTASIPVIFLTAQKKDPSSIEHGLSLGAEEYLTKPIDIDELLVRTRWLVRLKRMEAELERTKADFTAMLIHDLRSPIGGIKSILELLEEPLMEKKPIQDIHRELLSSAEEAAVHVLQLINDMLDLSKFEAGKMTLIRTHVPLKEIAETIIKQLSAQLRQKEINVKTFFEEDVPPIFADAHKVEQVFSNILSNALKFTPSHGTIMISVEKREKESLDEATFIQASLSNEGPGILPAELPMIFERYKQGSAAQVVPAKSTGLGLAICKLIVEAHGGTIAAESEPGKLTTIRFSLPADAPA
jgi:two-component system sensor histidine kinase/response regulator